MSSVQGLLTVIVNQEIHIVFFSKLSAGQVCQITFLPRQKRKNGNRQACKMFSFMAKATLFMMVDQNDDFIVTKSKTNLVVRM